MGAAAAERQRRRAPRLAALSSVAWMLAALGVRADQQMDAGLGTVLEQAIATTRCAENADGFDEEVFFKLQEPRLRRFVHDPQLRVDILQSVYCVTHDVVRRYREQQHVNLRLTPELVLALIEVESRFDRYAVSTAGAVGLMQVMPFWPKRLGVENQLFGSIGFNVRLGCEILGFYMHRERNDYWRALARYNGSAGRRDYPELVLRRLSSRWRA